MAYAEDAWLLELPVLEMDGVDFGVTLFVQLAVLVQ